MTYKEYIAQQQQAIDENCLKAAFAAYDLAYPDYDFECTLLKSRKDVPANSIVGGVPAKVIREIIK